MGSPSPFKGTTSPSQGSPEVAQMRIYRGRREVSGVIAVHLSTAMWSWVKEETEKYSCPFSE